MLNSNNESSVRLHIAVSCGGTGGHTFPGLAAAEELKKRGHRITLWMAGKDVETSALQEWDGPVVQVPAEGFQSGLSFRTLLTAARLIKAIVRCFLLMRRERPDVILGMGSYASVGPLTAALFLKIPVVLHEANVIPGRATRLFAKRARTVGIAFEATRHWLKQNNLHFTGMPLRPELIEAARNSALPIFNGTLYLLITGGSGGAKALNEILPPALIRCKKAGYSLQINHLTGRSDPESIGTNYTAADIPNETRSFSHEMGRLYRNAHLVIARAGASTCAELALFKRPALLIPFPAAANNHQTFNAQTLEKAGSADLLPQEELTADWLADYIRGFFEHPDRLDRMSAAANKLAVPDAVNRLADLVENRS